MVTCYKLPNENISLNKYKSLLIHTDYRAPIDKKFPLNFSNFLMDAWATIIFISDARKKVPAKSEKVFFI